MRDSRRSVSGQSAGEALRSLAIAGLSSIDGFRVELQRYCARAIELCPVVMDSGAPPGFWLRTAAADYLYYESQTSPFHQAHILRLLVGRVLLHDGSGSTFDLRLVPDLSPQIARLILGDHTQIAETDDEAERLVFRAMEHEHRRVSRHTARHFLRQLRPLHAALIDAIPEAARAEVPGRSSPRMRLHRAVVEIREAVLALRPYIDPELAAAARKVVHPAGPAGDEVAAAVEASVLAAALRARASGPPALATGGIPEWQHMPGPDLPSEAAWLARVARAFDRDAQPAGHGWAQAAQRTAGKSSEGVVTMADRARGGRVQGRERD
jgi:hypothetical protein